MRPELSDALKRTIIGVHKDKGAMWIERFEDLILHCESRWGLRIVSAYPPSYHYVADVVLSDGSEAVLKLGVPGKEQRSEAETLRVYGGRGAARLLEADTERGILLLERLKPGLTLHSMVDDEEAVRIAAGVMRNIARPAPAGADFPTTSDWAAGLSKVRQHFDGGTGPLPEALVNKAEKLYAELNGTIRRPLLLHGDLHHGNIISAEREPWLAIDPKGLIGEAEFGVIQFLFNNLPDNSDIAAVMERRIAQFAKELDLDSGRVAAWTFCHAVLSAWWCLEDNGPDFEDALQTAIDVQRLLSDDV